MTEQQWLNCTDPFDMVALPEVRSSERKLRFFVLACCRRVWHLLSQGHRQAVEIAERFADGHASAAELALTLTRANTRNSKAVNKLNRTRTAANLRQESLIEPLPIHAPFEAFQAVFTACSPPGSLQSPFRTFAGRYRGGGYYVMRGVDGAAKALAYCSTPEGEFSMNEAALASERAEQCRLLRDLIDNPFRPACIDPAWLSWHDGLLVSMARQMYESRDFPNMPILADALEEAGCTDQDILDHCRSGGEHVRGCWAVDLLLGKS